MVLICISLTTSIKLKFNSEYSLNAIKYVYTKAHICMDLSIIYNVYIYMPIYIFIDILKKFYTKNKYSW